MAVAKITTGNYTLTLTFSEQSTNASQNSSTLSYSLILTKSAGYAWNMAQCPYSVTLNGSVLKSGTTSYDFRNYKSLTLASGETSVTHNADGTGSCTFSGYFNGDNHTAGLEALTTPTETLTLTTIDQGGGEPSPDPDPEDVTPGSPIIDLPGEHLSRKILMLDLTDDFEDEIEEFQNVLNAAVSTYGDALTAARANLESKQEILDQLRKSGTATKEQIAAAEDDVAVAQAAVNAARADYNKVYSEASFMEYVPTSTELLTHANTFIAENDLTTPEVNLTLDFYQLSGLKNRIDLGDTVSVYFEKLGVSATAKCIKTTWNVLLDRYEAIELGSVKASISDTLAGATQIVQQQQEIIYNTEAEINRTIGKVEQNQLTLDSVKISSESAVRNADLAQAAAEEASAKADAASEEAGLANDNASAAATSARAAQDAADAAQAAADAVAENVAEQQGRLSVAEEAIDEHAESIQGLQSIVGDTGEWSATDTIASIFKDQQTAINQNAHDIETSASSVTVTKLDAAQVASDLAAANGNVDEARLALQQTIDAADDAAVNAAAASGYATQARTAATTARAAADDAYDDWQDAQAELDALIQGGGTPEQIAEAEAAVATAQAAYNAADASADDAEAEATRAEAVATETAAISARADAQVTAARAAVTAAQDAADAAAADRASLLARISTAETNITQNSQAIALKASQTDLTLLDDRKNQIFTGTTTPVDPQVGDLWFKSQNEPILTYVDQNGTQTWVEFNKYTDDSTANGVANNLANNYYTKTQTDAAFVVQAESITSTVASTYATISSVNTLSDTVDDAVDLANAKGRVFTTTPTPPYDIGDLWVEGSNGDIFKCKIAKVEGQTYSSTDWDLASKYTDDTAANAVANNLSQNYYTKTQTNTEIEQTASSITSSVTELIENIQIGGRNLLRDTKKDAGENHTTYDLAWFDFTEHLIEGEEYTISAKITTSSERKSVAFYHSGDIIAMTPWLATAADGIYVYTFTATASMASQTSHKGYGYCMVYASNNANGAQGSTPLTGSGHIDWIQIEKGNKATDWSPAPEDYKTYVENNYSTITQTANQISSAVSASKSYTDNSIDGIQIGGTNLLRHTADMTISGASHNWRASGGVVSISTETELPVQNVNRALRVTNSSSSIANIGTAQDRMPGFVSQELYSQGCWIRASSAGLNITLQPLWDAIGEEAATGGHTVGKTTTEWQYVKIEGLENTAEQRSYYSAGYVYVYGVPANGWFEVCANKVEQGNKATAWSPNPEDIEDDYNSKFNSVELNMSELSQTSSAISLEVNKKISKTEYDENNVAISEELSTLSSRIEQTATSIRTVVSEETSGLEAQSEKISRWLDFSVDDYLTIGQYGSAYKTQITDKAFNILHGSSVIGSFNNVGLNTSAITLSSSLSLPPFTLESINNGTEWLLTT